MNILHKIPLLRIVIFFVIGIIIHLIGVNYKYALLGFFPGILMILLYFLITKSQENRFSYRWVFGLGVSIISISAGLIFMHKAAHKGYYDSPYFVGRVIDSPKEGEKSVCCIMDLSQIHNESDSVSNNLKAIVFLPKDERSTLVSKGDSIALFLNNLPDYMIDDSLPVSSIQSEVECADASFFIKESDWTVISHSNTSFSVARDSMLSMMKKKD